MICAAGSAAKRGWLEHLLGEGKPLRRAIESGRLHSMIFWGPPGTGKTLFAKAMATSSEPPVIT